ncbi:hypothetical protein acdb102_45140 [Acidothermaceae bacterium B102]|nr:hypothetical protein acdb102_45140 [Acidothermaceae bacterium B102]
MTAPVTSPPPPAYPDPITLPVSPHGDPTAARLLADAYRALAADLDRAGSHVDAIVGDLALRWHGQGASALRVAHDTLGHNVRTVAAACRSAADHLDDYATALHKAQHHHGWSLGKLVAVGAIVTITAVAVVVTVGAAAPVGTVAAMEVGEAIVGAEAAAGAASAAEAAATEGLSLAGQSMGALRGLTAVALPHLAQGGVSSGIDLVLHLTTGHGVTGRDLGESFLAGALMSGTAATTRSALRASEAYAGASAAGKAALDTAALTATLTADTALGQYAATGRVNPTALTEDALLTALTGGASTLRHPLDGTGAIAKRVPTGQDIGDLSKGADLRLHQGPEAPYGHTLSKHVAKDEQWLLQRLDDEPWIKSASSFDTRATAEAAVKAAIEANPEAVEALLAGRKARIEIRVSLPHDAGTVVARDGTTRPSRKAVIRLRRLNRTVVVSTAFLE